ncbi:MAG: hypothetical protein JXA30_14905 [Deltaproteobacteria bacterium]|nr:hypothetical protein [Deltaproteobacteria bacterium]
MTDIEGRSQLDRSRINQWGIFILGLNVWLVANLWPIGFSTGEGAWWESYALGFPPFFLALGLWLIGRRNELAQGVLLALFPITLITPVALRSESDNQLDYAPFVLFFAVISLVAYAAFTADSFVYLRPRRHSEHQPLAFSNLSADNKARRRLRNTVSALTLFGAFCILCAAVSLNGFTQLYRDWGNAALQAGLLTTLFASALAVAVILNFFFRVLKSGDDYSPVRSEWRRRLISALVLSVIGFLTYYLTQTH